MIFRIFPRFPVEFLWLFPTTQVFGAYFGLAAATVLGPAVKDAKSLLLLCLGDLGA